jgi:hypothetical protein
MQRILLAAAIASASTMVGIGSANAQTYAFKNIAEGRFPDFFDDPVISAGGTVAVPGQFSGNLYAIYVGNNVPLDYVHGMGSVHPRRVGVGVSGSGDDFAFLGQTGFAMGHGLYKVSGGTTTNLTADLIEFQNSPPSINNHGMVAFSTSAPGTPSHIYVANETMRTPVVDTSGPFFAFRDTLINDSGTVVFEARLDASPNQYGIYKTQGGVLTTIADPTSGQFQRAENPSFNNAGDVAFRGTLIGGGVGHFLSRGGVVTPYNFGSVSYIGGGHINSAGDLTFIGSLGGVNSIYTHSAAGVHKVISSNDALFGSTVSTYFLGRGYSDGGEVVFEYELADGRRGVAVATPVPEPATALLLGISCAVLWRRRTG